MKNIAIIPARSGSKGLKDKNIKLLNGIPLMAYSIHAAKEANLFDEIMVSTDSEKYAEIARGYDAAVPFLRSEQCSNDTAGSWEAVREVLDNYRKLGKLFDTVCLLQPTSPLRVAEDIIGGYRVLEEKKANAVTSVCEMEHSLLWTMTLPDDLSMREFRKGHQNLPRQQLQKYYRLNGALYIRKITYKESEIIIESDREYAYIIEQGRSVDIDTREDFEYAEFIISKHQYFAQ